MYKRHADDIPYEGDQLCVLLFRNFELARFLPLFFPSIRALEYPGSQIGSRKRARCGDCVGCKESDDCGICTYCQDKNI